MYRGIILLGTNLGDKNGNLKRACDELAKVCEVVLVSAIYETPSWGYESKETFYNQAIEFTTGTSPIDFINVCLNAEKTLGRYRENSGFSDRIIDIDILVIENFVLNSEELIVPHPRLHKRKFALIPLQELWPNWIHPVFGITIDALRKRCEDNVIPHLIR